MHGELNLRLTDRALLLVLAALGLAWLLRHATHIVVVLFLAVLLAAAVSGAANRLARLRIGRAPAILLAYLLVLAVLLGLAALLVPLVAGEVALLRANLPRYQDQADALLARLPAASGAPLRVDDLTAQLGGRLEGAAVGLSRGALAVLLAAPTGQLWLVFAAI